MKWTFCYEVLAGVQPFSKMVLRTAQRVQLSFGPRQPAPPSPVGAPWSGVSGVPAAAWGTLSWRPLPPPLLPSPPSAVWGYPSPVKECLAQDGRRSRRVPVVLNWCKLSKICIEVIPRDTPGRCCAGRRSVSCCMPARPPTALWVCLFCSRDREAG